jgi:xanthine dehydrogenase YagR molybdenum-binding subunit
VLPPVAKACAELKRLAGGAFDDVPAGLEAVAASAADHDRDGFAFHSFGAQFCEVRYDEDLARVRVTRFTGVFDCGCILNPKTARSQMAGGIIMGLGMALMEESARDPRTGALPGNNFADYHVPVNADIPPIDVAFVEYPDLRFNALGVRGIGEIGLTGVAAAVANAVYHASGRRVRDLPILPERLL